MNTTRNGKIARLPKAVRDELNRRFSDGVPGMQLVAWLNGLPEVQRIMAAEFDGRAVREQNLSQWKQGGGYGDWQRQQEALELVRDLAAEGEELQSAAAGPLAEKLVVWLAARYAVAARKLGSQNGDGEPDWARLREFCQDLVALRRGDHSAARLKIEQERLEREREKTEEDVVAHFQRWAENPKVREWMLQENLRREESDRRIREILGLAPTETQATAGENHGATNGKNEKAVEKDQQ